MINFSARAGTSPGDGADRGVRRSAIRSRTLQYVDAAGRAFLDVPLDRDHAALDDRYVYLLRSDLERILLEGEPETGRRRRPLRDVDHGR